MNGELIQIADGAEKFSAYLSKSSTGSGPGIVVIQEWWGLVDHIKEVCDRFAAEGFTALAPDLYQGQTTTEPDEAATLMQALHIGETEVILRAAIETLLADEATSPKDKAGVVGFCMGGQLALFAGAHNPSIKATVDFYGIHPAVQPSFRSLSGPVLGIFAQEDSYASPEVVKALDEELTLLEKTHEFITYPGTDHAFFNNHRPSVYNAEAAADAWLRMTRFFRETLFEERH